MRSLLKYKKFLLVLLCGIFTASSFAQNSVVTANTSNEFVYSVNTILCCIALTLLFIIILLAGTVNSAISLYKEKKEVSTSVLKNVVLMIGFIFLAQISTAQDAGSQTSSKYLAPTTDNLYFYGFLTVIVLEVAIIIFLIKALRFLTGIEKLKTHVPETTAKKSLWERINKMKPLSEEGNLDTGHEYDGIRELDNITPPWFTVGFLATILFAVVYMYRYHISHSAPLQIEEYTNEVNAVKAIQDSMLKLEGNKVDENTVVMLGNTDIEAGHKVFSGNCAPCHGDKGQGIVGPNLTDEYWLHGGSIHDVFKSIKYGWADKGMKSWKDDFSPTQIAQLASYVKSLKGSNPPGAKEKQGELYTDNVTEKVKTSSASFTGATGK